MTSIDVTIDLDGIRVAQHDVNDLSRQWRHVMSNVEYPPPAAAMRLLSALVMAYLRGRGCHMNDREGLERHTDKAKALIQAVAEGAAQRFDDMDRFADGVNGCLESAHKAR